MQHGELPVFLRRRRWWLLALLLWWLSVGWSLRAQLLELEQHSVALATEGARNMFRMVVLTRLWNADHGGVYVPVTPRTQPNPYLQHPRRDIATTTGEQLTLINPAYMTRLIAEKAQAETGAVFHLTSLRPIRPQNAPDRWESEALNAFEAGVREMVAVQPGPDGGALLRYMAPLMVEAPCLVCHKAQGYEVGDVRGGISVSLHYDRVLEANQTLARQSMAVHAAVAVAVSVALWWLLTLLRGRWQDLLGKMSELEGTRNELVRSEKMASLGRMVAGFAHEINTPVGVAVGAVSQHEEGLRRIEAMLEQEDVSEVALREELEQLRRGGALALSNLRRAASLVQSFKRTSIDQSSDQVRRFAMRQLIDDVVFTLHHHLKRLPVQIAIDCDPRVQISNLPGLFEQLFTNLIENAVQHGFDGGTRAGQIRIAAALEGATLRIEFADNGAGMTEDQQARIFEPFFTTRRAQGGSGLGLYICYTIVHEQLRGRIECTSAPGQGCRFTIRVPAQRDPDPSKVVS